MKFQIGQYFTESGVEYRVVQGNRCCGDMVIEIRVGGGRWHRPKMAHTLILAAFKFQVEENNYGNGKVKKGRGGYYWIDSIIRACKLGWKAEVEGIARQAEIRAAERAEERQQLGLF